MRRADRLFDIIRILRTATRPLTAAALAAFAGDQMVADGRGRRRRRDTGLAFSMYRYDGPAAPQCLCGSPQPVQLVKPADPTDPAINRVLATIRSVIGLSPSSSLLPSRSGRISGSGAIPAIYQTAINGRIFPIADLSDRELIASLEYARALTVAPAAGYMRIPGVGQAPL